MSLIVIMLPILIAPDPTNAVFDVPNLLNVGPYVDKVVFKVIPNQDQRILALQAGEIEMDLNPIYSTDLLSILEDSNIEVYESTRYGYGHITINCARYPLNISELRRAFAFAFDKTRVTTEIFDGDSIEHDSVVPAPSEWCIENDFEWHYYTNRADIGNQILDNMNFSIDPETGYRLAPDGSYFSITIEYASSSPEIAGGIAQIGVDALLSLHVDAEKQAVAFNEYHYPGYDPKDYDMKFYALNFGSDDVDWLAYEYWSEYADVPYQNPTNFRNATYDSWRDQLLHGTTYEEVYEACAAMQRILHYNVPRLVVYVNKYYHPYRNDVFTGHIPDKAQRISGSWTLRKLHRIDGSSGGTVPIAIAQEPDSFNIFVSNSAYSQAIFKELWPSLYKYAPDLTPYPELAETIQVERHFENPLVPEGYTRFIIDIIHNATWSDGEPLTAEDVAFTLNYELESSVYHNPASTNLGDLVAAYAPTPYRVIVEFGTESFWHFSNFAFDYIIPKHIFNVTGGIGLDEWNLWNPVFNPAEPYVTSGPFELTDFEAGEFYEISKTPDFAYASSLPPPDHVATTPTPSPTPSPINPITLASTVVAGVSSVIILVMMIEIIQHKRLSG
jgi:ABC-type transport system substrate-binding protein